MTINLNEIYNKLLKQYNHQGWWPLTDIEGNNPTKTGSIKGYHPKDYSFPKNKKQEFEICLGCILTQNTSWVNVEKAILNLRNNNLLDDNKILLEKEDKIKDLIKPAGFFNQKYNYIINFIKIYRELKTKPTREELLKIKGIGRETADSMLLFAFKIKTFVVDSYTKRILKNLNLIKEDMSYEEIKNIIESNFKGSVNEYQEFHALLVEHAKHFYQKKEDYKKDFLLEV